MNEGNSVLAERSRLLVVAVALIDHMGRILVQQRPEGKPMAGLWEFPGGKVESNETPESGLIRELDEELGIRPSPGSLTPLTFASEPLGDRDLLLLLYTCRVWEGELILKHAKAMRWVTASEMRDLPMPPADLPMIDILEAVI